MHHDWYDLFRHFWWLIFPLFWMIASAGGLWSRHARANRMIDLMKTYAQQGKEPPPEVLQALQGPFGRGGREECLGRRHGHGWIPVCLFTALCAGFLFLAFQGDIVSHDDMSGLIFVAIIMGGLALGFLVSTLLRGRGDTDRTLPK